jgi:hypothetical protein
MHNLIILIFHIFYVRALKNNKMIFFMNYETKNENKIHVAF